MLVDIRKILSGTLNSEYAVLAINVDNEHNARAAIRAAEEMNSPLIINVTPYANPDLLYFGKMLNDLSKSSSVNICLNLDHGKSFEDCVLGIKAGFTNVMIDKSEENYEDNIREVKRVVEIAHAFGVTVEAELGHVGVGLNYGDSSAANFTNVDEAVEFVSTTNIDALAVAIGTAHGVYKGEPNIHFDLLRDLKSNLSIPLVLHGASSTGDENLLRCAKEGISKINLSNDIRKAGIDNLLEEGVSGNSVYKMYEHLSTGMENKIKYYMNLCGSINKN